MAMANEHSSRLAGATVSVGMDGSHTAYPYPELMARVIGLIRVDEIYHNRNFVAIGSHGELVIFVPQAVSNPFAEYMPLLDMVFRDYPDLSYRLFNSQRAKEEAKRRNIFYHFACRIANRLYANPTSSFRLADYLCPTAGHFLAEAKAYFDSEMAKVLAFRDGVSLYFGTDNRPFAAFMLHQQLELTYRVAELFVMGRDKVTHSINAHQRYTASYIPRLGNIFDQRDEAEQRLAMQLDDAYLATRYGHGYAIKNGKLAEAIEKADAAYRTTLAIYTEIEQLFTPAPKNPIFDPMANRRNQTNDKPPKRSDELLKGAFEENFPDFLRFLYPDADRLFDFDRGLTFMDKELLEIIPDRERTKGKRVADLLVKVYLKDGSEQHILLNTEIEGGSDAEFAERIYQYNYRIWDRYRIAVATIAVYTGGHSQPKPHEYRREVLDTFVHFRYRTYHIFDHAEDDLLQMDNAFALIVLACQKALLEGKVPERELGEGRTTIARALIASGRYDKDRILGFLGFLKNFIFIDDEEINRNFDKFIYEVTGGTIEMGVIEVLKEQERQKGVKDGERKKALDIAREMKNDGIPVDQIVKFTKLTAKEIEKL
ncbi:hypothetical protein SAMN05421740_104217 [Parapedobacter koreensis]|uniref:HEPN domain-containing protein n=2 Tax=Parapedobacter koreensis TaxID=332977 RepID=A0A1H7P5J2_9SPHI|nr:hypothetical protein SAMN05421740_104217 [Parapedobacter koreensis]